MLDVRRYPRESLRDEKGMVLVVVLLLISVLLLLGSTAVMTSTTDMKISANYKAGNQAFYAAEAGVEEMRARLRGSLSDTVIIKDPNYPDSKWSAYIITSGSWTTSSDPDYTSYNTASYKKYIPISLSQTNTTVQANTLQSTVPIIPYWVRVKHKTEYDAEQQGHTTGHPHYADLDGNTTGGHTLAAPGNIVYYGYRNATSTTLECFTSSSTPSKSRANPVEIIRAQGSASNGSARVVEVEVRSPISTSVPGAVYGDVIGGWGTVTVNGNDNCTSDSVPALAYVTGQTLYPSGNVSCVSNVAPASQVATISIADKVATLQTTATEILTDTMYNNYSVGSASDYRVVYCNADALADKQLDFQNLTGYGILVVKGDVYFSGNLTWHGLIIASGNTSFYGDGSEEKNIYGAVLSNTTAALQGKVSVKYDSCEIDKANQSLTPVTSIWNEKAGS